RLSCPLSRFRLPLALKVPPVIEISPGVPTEIMPMPLLKVPLLSTSKLPMMLEVLAPVIVSAELAPVIVTVPGVAALLDPRNRLDRVTVAPLWMLSDPFVPAAMLLTVMAPNAPEAPLLNVRLPALPFCPIVSEPPLKLEPPPSTVAVPLPEEPMRIAPAPLETAPPTVTFVALPPLMLNVEVV